MPTPPLLHRPAHTPSSCCSPFRPAIPSRARRPGFTSGISDLGSSLAPSRSIERRRRTNQDPFRREHVLSTAMGNHKKLVHFLRADPAAAKVATLSSSPRSGSSVSDDDGYSSSSFPSSPSRCSTPRSPWAYLPGLGAGAGADEDRARTGVVASMVKEGGKVYSLAAAGDLLYTGTDSENVRVWRRDGRELAGFRSGSGLVKAIVVAADGRIFTGHQDGKVRVWRADDADPAVHRRVGSLPALGDFLMSSVNPSCYVRTRRGRGRRRAVWLRHCDAVSCLSLDVGAGLLYSGSWDRTFKVWRLSDSRCLESVPAHDDAVNSVAAAGFDGLLLTGSADGTVKVWRREESGPNTGGTGDRTRHVLERVLRNGDGAATAIAVSPEARVVYVGSSDGLVTCWRWVNGEARYGGVLVGHKMAVMCLAASGRVVVSGSADGSLCAWRRDGAQHVALASLAGHTGPVKCVSVAGEDDDTDVAEDRRRLVVYSGSLDGSVKVWRLSEELASLPGPTTQQEPPLPLPPATPPRESWDPRPELPPPATWSPCQPAPGLKRVAAT